MMYYTFAIDISAKRYYHCHIRDMCITKFAVILKSTFLYKRVPRGIFKITDYFDIYCKDNKNICFPSIGVYLAI